MTSISRLTRPFPASKAGFTAAALGLWLVLAVWAQLSEGLRDWLALPCWLLLLGLCWRSMNEQALVKRRVWLDQYLLPGGFVHRLLRGGLLLRLLNLPIAVFLSAYLLVKTLGMTWPVWSLLLASILIFAGCRFFFEYALRNQVQASRLAPLTRRLALVVTAVVLVISYCAILIYTPQPLLIASELTDVLANHRPALAENPSLLMMADQLVRGGELFGWWALQNSLGSAGGGSLIALTGWGVLLLSGAAFLWTWCQVMLGLASWLEQQRL